MSLSKNDTGNTNCFKIRDSLLFHPAVTGEMTSIPSSSTSISSSLSAISVTAPGRSSASHRRPSHLRATTTPLICEPPPPLSSARPLRRGSGELPGRGRQHLLRRRPRKLPAGGFVEEGPQRSSPKISLHAAPWPARRGARRTGPPQSSLARCSGIAGKGTGRRWAGTGDGMRMVRRGGTRS